MRVSGSSQREVVRDIIAAAALGMLCLAVIAATLILYPRGSLHAQNPTPSKKFAVVVPPSTVPPNADGIVVEGLLYGCAGLPTLQEVQESTVYWLNQGYEVWTELSINHVECSKMLSQFEDDILSIVLRFVIYG